MSEVQLWAVAVGNMPTRFTPRKIRKAGIAALKFIKRLDGFVGVTPIPPRGTLCLFRTENDAKCGMNLMNSEGIATGKNICDVFVDEKYVREE